MIKKVFVTGGSGFLGAYIIRALVQKNYEVIGLRRKRQLPFFIGEQYFSGVRWVEGDLFDLPSLQEGMKDADAVIHSAAKVSMHSSDREIVFKTNVEGTSNVVNTAIACSIPRLVHVSSIAAVGRLQSGEEVTEELKWDPTWKTTHYAKSKYLAELEVWRGMAEGLNGVIANPSTILGYGDWTQSSCAIFKNVFSEFPWYTSGMNGFVDVEDVAEGVVLLMESTCQNERFILNAENWTFQDLFNTIADGFMKKRPGRLATPFLSGVAWRWEYLKSLVSGTRPLLTRESAQVANSITRFSNAKIRMALPGFSFTPLHASIQKACKQYLQHIALQPVGQE